MNLQMPQFYFSIATMKLLLALALFTFFLGGTTPTKKELEQRLKIPIPLQNNISKFLPLYLKNRLKRQLTGVFHAKPKPLKILKMRKRRPKLVNGTNSNTNELRLESGRPQRNFTAVEIVVKKRVDYNSEGPLGKETSFDSERKFGQRPLKNGGFRPINGKFSGTEIGPLGNVVSVENERKFGQKPENAGFRPVDGKLSGSEMKPFVKYRSSGKFKPTETNLPKQISNPISIQSTEPNQFQNYHENLANQKPKKFIQDPIPESIIPKQIPTENTEQLPEAKPNLLQNFMERLATQKPRKFNQNPTFQNTLQIPIEGTKPIPKLNPFQSFIQKLATQKPNQFTQNPNIQTTQPPKLKRNLPGKRTSAEIQIPQEQISDGELDEADLRDYLEGHQVFGARGDFKIPQNEIQVPNFKQNSVPRENTPKQLKNSNVPRNRKHQKPQQIQKPTYPPLKLNPKPNPRPKIKATQPPKELEENLIYTANSHPTTPTKSKPTTFEYSSNEEKSTQFPQLTKSALDELFKAGHPAVARAPESNTESETSKQPAEPPEKFDPDSDRFYGSPRLAENNDHNFERVYEPVEYADRRNDDDSFLKDFVSLDDNFDRLPKAEKDDEELFGGREYNYNDDEEPIEREEEDSGTRKTKENRDEYSPQDGDGEDEGPPTEDFDQSYIDALKAFDEELKKIQRGDVENNNNQALVISSPGPVVSYQRPASRETTEEEEKEEDKEEDKPAEKEERKEEEEEEKEEERPKEESRESEEEEEERNPKEESKDESVKIKKVLRVKTEGDNSKNGNLDEDILNIEREFAASGRI